MSKNTKIALFFIIILAFFLRIYQVAKIPPHLNRDEVSQAYNAYSILKTGKDEYGRLLPISIKSFGDYKLPMATYFSVPIIAVFGLQEWTVRLPSILIGTLTVLIIFFLSQKLLKINNKKSMVLGLITAFLLAVNPWHVYFSRVLYESVFEIFFISLGIYFFIKSVEEKKSLIISSIFFSLSLYTYHGAHIFVPLFFFSLIYLFRKSLFKIPKTKFAIIIFIIAFSITFGENYIHGYKARLNSQTMINDPNIRYLLVDRRLGEHTNQDSLSTKFFHNIYLALPYRFVYNYLQSFSPDFLFFKGGSVPGQNLEDFGNLLIVEGFLIIIGLYFLIRKNYKFRSIILLWIFITPLVSIFTTEVPHTPRNFTLVIPFILLAGLGLFNLLKLKNIPAKVVLFIFFLAAIHNYASYYESYFYHLPIYRARYWDYGFKQTVEVYQAHQNVSKVVMNDMEDYPYIYFSFYLKYPPKQYQQEAEYYPPGGGGLASVKHFSKFYFNEINYDNLEKNVLYFVKNKDLPENVKTNGQINLPQGETLLKWFIVGD